MQEITDSSIPDGGTVEYRLIILPPLVYMTASLLRPYCFDPNVKATESFYYFKYPVNATISLLPSGFYCPTVVASTGFHCSRDMILAEIKKNLIVFLTQLRVSVSYGMPISSHMFMLRLWRWLQHRLSKRQSLSTTLNRTNRLNLLIKWLLASNLSQFYVHLDDRANHLQTTKTLTLKMTTVEVVNQPARKMFSRGLLRSG